MTTSIVCSGRRQDTAKGEGGRKGTNRSGENDCVSAKTRKERAKSRTKVYGRNKAESNTVAESTGTHLFIIGSLRGSDACHATEVAQPPRAMMFDESRDSRLSH
jgi:hypothetical protein